MVYSMKYSYDLHPHWRLSTLLFRVLLPFVCSTYVVTVNGGKLVELSFCTQLNFAFDSERFN